MNTWARLTSRKAASVSIVIHFINLYKTATQGYFLFLSLAFSLDEEEVGLVATHLYTYTMMFNFFPNQTHLIGDKTNFL